MKYICSVCGRLADKARHPECQKKVRAEQHRAYDQQRPSASERGYDYEWKRIRDAVLREEDFCYLCGGPNPDSVDHVVPKALGGDNSRWNLRAAHITCNKRKGKKPLEGGR